MGRTVISGESVLIQETLIHGKQIYLVPRNNALAIAEGILILKQQPSYEKNSLNKAMNITANTIASGFRENAFKTLRELAIKKTEHVG